MPEVDMAAVWYVGGTVFMAWFAVLASIGNFLFVRVSTQFSLRRTILAVFAMTGISWLFVAAFPFPLYASMVIFQLCGHQYPPIGWLIVPVLLSSLMAAFVGVTVLVGFHEKKTLSAFWWQFAVNLTCIGISFFRMMTYALPVQIVA